MRRWVLIRRLYEPRFQLIVATALLAVLAAYYAIWSIGNWINLDAPALRFDFQSYFTVYTARYFQRFDLHDQLVALAEE